MFLWRNKQNYPLTRAVRGSDYSPTIVLSEEKDKFVTENWRKRKKWTNKATNKQQQPNSCINHTCTHCPHVPSFKFLGLKAPEKNVTKIVNVWKLERKKNKEIKGQTSGSSLILVHPPTVNKCTKFKLFWPHSSGEKCDENFKFLNIGEKVKKGQARSSSLTAVYMIHPPIDHVCIKCQLYRPHNF